MSFEIFELAPWSSNGPRFRLGVHGFDDPVTVYHPDGPNGRRTKLKQRATNLSSNRDRCTPGVVIPDQLASLAAYRARREQCSACAKTAGVVKRG